MSSRIVYAIQTAEEYEAVLIEIGRLLGAKPGTPEAEELDKLTDLVCAYEDAHWPLDDEAETLDPANEAWD